MGGIPGVGSIRGVFELFLPGIFLLLSIIGAVYSSPIGVLDPDTSMHITWLASNIPAATVIAIPIGYLIGVILRLFKTDAADHLSARYLRRGKRLTEECKALIDSKDSTEQQLAKDALLYLSRFPYSGWLEYVVRCMLPKAAFTFYKDTWASCPSTKQFVNYCKVIIIAKNPTAGAEISALEAMSRFVASMMYAQIASIVAFCISMGCAAFTRQWPEAWVPLVTSGYVVGVWAILRSLRFLRLKEVEAIFAATFALRDQFSDLWQPPKETS